MSALARSFLVACACAALGAARASVTDPGPDNALALPYEGFCHSELRGYKSRTTAALPEILIPAEQDNFTLDIPDKCAELSMELVGGVVTACDADAKPAMVLAPMAAGAGEVRRRGAMHTTAHCYVKLYCI